MSILFTAIDAEVGADIDVPISSDDEIIESDGEPLESEWHVLAIPLLLDVIDWHLRGREDYFVGGNMFIYYREKKTRKRRFKGPDFFFVEGAQRRPPRSSWVVWNEGGRFPDVIIELTSPKTEFVDASVKKDAYQNIFKTPEYFCYDPRDRLLSGWRLRGKKYVEIPADNQGRLWSEELEMSLGSWLGRFHNVTAHWLRFFTRDGVLLPTEAEARELMTAKEKSRADALERELKALKASLRKAKNGNGVQK